MVEYTYEDIIMDPEDPRLEGAIGKECYFENIPKVILRNARGSDSSFGLFYLKEINKTESFPFVDENGDDHPFIIIKKEEPKPKYVPFKSITEFLDAYKNLKGCITEEELFLYIRGIWFKDKFSKAYCMVAKIEDMGVFVVNYLDRIPWEKLLEYYTFLDGSPCGKEVK